MSKNIPAHSNGKFNAINCDTVAPMMRISPPILGN